MLRGNYPARVDEKGRLKLPTEFRAQLDAVNPEHRFYITSFDGVQARVYPMPVWEEIERKLAALPSMHPTKQKLLSRTNYYGQVVEMDGQGRVLAGAVAANHFDPRACHQHVVAHFGAERMARNYLRMYERVLAG